MTFEGGFACRAPRLEVADCLHLQALHAQTDRLRELQRQHEDRMYRCRLRRGSDDGADSFEVS